MARKSYPAEFKVKLVLEVIQGEREPGEIAAANAERVFAGNRQAKKEQRREEALKKEKEQMLKTIGQLTLERDFLQDCFRKAGKPIPRVYQN